VCWIVSLEFDRLGEWFEDIVIEPDLVICSLDVEGSRDGVWGSWESGEGRRDPWMP